MQTEAGTPLSPSTRPSGVTRRGSIGVLVLVAVIGYALDQSTKAWAVSALTPGEPKELVGSLLRLRLTFNPGAAFSIATNATWVLTIIATAVIAFTIFSARKLRSRAWALGLGLLIGGALGNLTDRFLREPSFAKGHVVDFLELPHWPIFNVADICVVSAACLIALLSIRGIGLDGSRLESSGTNAESTADMKTDAKNEADTDE
ncbi:signal peptidase II [Calidifontibacter indicus]|uniref:Lipoprotein signal peptidase n=1 Tax=Calidifontibacter indicus TaxID=419650 RepID=A0A3D9UQA5_9MICO|nr:signal peptidase II [Calidifontibacter indicus]REF31497.1 signal peptidase II [Calidifontibacter indicus]